MDGFFEEKPPKMDPQIDPESHFLITFSRHLFRTRFGEAEKVKISVSSRRYAHFQRSKGVKKTPKKHPKNFPKPPKTRVKIESFFLIVFFRILVPFWPPKWLQNGGPLKSASPFPLEKNATCLFRRFFGFWSHFGFILGPCSWEA